MIRLVHLVAIKERLFIIFILDAEVVAVASTTSFFILAHLLVLMKKYY